MATDPNRFDQKSMIQLTLFFQEFGLESCKNYTKKELIELANASGQIDRVVGETAFDKVSEVLEIVTRGQTSTVQVSREDFNELKERVRKLEAMLIPRNVMSD